MKSWSARTTRRRTWSRRSPGRRSTPKTSGRRGCCSRSSSCSPMPHARVARIDTSAALAMPGVKAILTADDLPAPADIVTDLGQTIRANPKGERALTNEPLYEGEPILAVAAVDEYTAAEAIEAIQIEYEPLPFVVDPLVRLRPGSPNARVEGQLLGPSARAAGAGWRTRRAAAAGRRDGAEVDRRDFAEYDEGKLPMGKPPTSGRTAISRPASRRPRSCSTRRSPRRTPAPDARAAHGDGVLAERQAVHAHRHAEHRADRRLDRALAAHRAGEHRAHQRVHRRRLRQQGDRRDLVRDSGAPVEEGQRAGDDAHHARGGALHRRRPPGAARPREGRLRQGRPDLGARHVRRSPTTAPTSRTATPGRRAASCR